MITSIVWAVVAVILIWRTDFILRNHLISKTQYEELKQDNIKLTAEVAKIKLMVRG